MISIFSKETIKKNIVSIVKFYINIEPKITYIAYGRCLILANKIYKQYI